MRPILFVLKILIVLNLAALAVFLLVIAGSFTEPVSTAIARQHRPETAAAMLLAVRAALLIGVFTIPFAHVVLTRLKAIVATVGAGDPFVPDNARRLTTIAWSLLAIQLLDLGFGAVAMAVEPNFGWSFSLTGWLAIVLLFVLARVFEHGTVMREELAGTV
jgi:hypothetical protein